AREPDSTVGRKARLQTFPVREMIKRGWIVESDDTSLLEQQMAQFFETASVSTIPHLAHAAKKTSYEDVPPAQLAWLFRVRHLAREMLVPKYSEKALAEALPKLSALMTAPEETRHVPRILSECGVRFVVVEVLPNAKIDGVCFWLESGRSPVIG